MESKYLVVDKSVLPDVFEKVLKVKELLRTGEAKGITEAVRSVGISRSTFYKYKDRVFILTDGTKCRKATIAMSLKHEPGVLSNILNKMADKKGNILTINQDIPINNMANVSMTFDISNLSLNLDNLLNLLRKQEGVVKLKLIAME